LLLVPKSTLRLEVKRTMLHLLTTESGTQRHSPSPPGRQSALGVERSHFIWAQPGPISTARDPNRKVRKGNRPGQNDLGTQKWSLEVIDNDGTSIV